MILRRIASALKRQDWATVLIEFILVILGVLIALQVNNWNEARIDKRVEQEAALRLHAELLANIDDAEERIQFYSGKQTLLNEYYVFLTGGADSRPVDDALRAALCRQGVLFMGRQTNSVYQELISTGRLGLISDIPARDALAAFHGNVASANAFIADLAHVRRDAYAQVDQFRTRMATDDVIGVATCAFDYLSFEAHGRAPHIVAELGQLEAALITINTFIRDSATAGAESLRAAYPALISASPEEESQQ